MREKSKKQLPPMNPTIDHPQARELDRISWILDQETTILEEAKQRRIKDVCFAKKRGLTVDKMCRSQWVYNRLRRFRAGVESIISWIKRCFGFDRCTWRGRRSFESYAWLSVVTANLITLARAKPA